MRRDEEEGAQAALDLLQKAPLANDALEGHVVCRTFHQRQGGLFGGQPGRHTRLKDVRKSIRGRMGTNFPGGAAVRSAFVTIAITVRG